MSATAGHPRLERLLAAVLLNGTWLGSIIVSAGLLLQLFGRDLASRGAVVVEIGVALFILLPILRVTVMLVVFARERDYRYASIAALVLTIVAAGALLGWRLAPGG